MDRLFLDANVLFSAAYGSQAILRLWTLAAEGRCELIASVYVADEARRNLWPAHLERLPSILEQVRQVPDAAPDLPCPIALPPKDRPVFLAAWAAHATHLVTGDVTHFGPHFGTCIAGVRIVRPGDYLKENRLGDAP